MIEGIVRSKEAIIGLEVSSPSQPPVQLEAILDTGFNGYLTLPNHIVAALQLPFAGHRRGTLADGSATLLEVYLATVSWHGDPRDILILRSESSPLIGMALLEKNRLTMDVVDGGRVAIEALR
jgi:clan AA aspartic protease